MDTTKVKKIREALYKARINKGLSAKKLAQLVGVSKTTIYRYEKGQIEKMPMQILTKLASVLNISPAFIAGLDPEPSLSKTISNNKINILPSKIRLVPVVGEIACGEPITANENIDDYLQEPEDSLPSGTVFYLKAKGHSMEPTIPDGADVLIRQQDEIEDNEIAAVLLNDNNEATLKRVKYQGSMLMLVPDNKNYKPIVITKQHPAKILGKAIRFTTNL